MEFKEFFGGSYESEAFYADQQTTINWYPSKIESSGRRVFLPTPGVETLSTAAVGAGRAHFFQNGREFAVIGAVLFEIDSAGNQTNRGAVALGGNPATISSNGDIGAQLLVTSGDNAYIFDLDTNTLTQVTELDGKATMGGFMDSRFFVLDAATSTFYFSDLAPDGDVWDTDVNFGKRSLAADRWLSMAVHDRNIFLLGGDTGEAWYDTGQAFPVAARPEGIFPYGIAAAFTARVLGDSLAWLARTTSGRLCVVQARGTSISVISDKALETAMERYDGISETVADVYTERGHTFYLLNFDHDDVTWVYDLEMGLWHKRGTWVSSESRYVSWRPRFYAHAFGEHRILDAFGGKVYHMDGRFGTDVDGLRIRRLRRAPVITSENKRLFFPGLELVMEPQETITQTSPAEVIANFTWSKDAESNLVSFDASTSVGDIDTWAWDFGDSSSSTEEAPSHSYASDGTYSVTLTVTDTDGNEASVTGTVTFETTPEASGSAEGEGNVDTLTSPQVMLRFSNDGGHTWSDEFWRAVGQDGEYSRRIRWLRLGSGRKRVFEVSTSDRLPFRISQCNLMEPANG